MTEADNPRAKSGDNSKNAAGDQIKAYIERVERLTEEKKAIAQDITDVYAEAKSNGFNVKVMRRIVRERARDKEAVEEENSLFATYAHAIGQEYLA